MWVLELRVGDAQAASARTLEAESCDDLARATVVVAAIAIDPLSGSEPREPPPIEPPEKPTPEPTPEPKVTPPPPLRESREPPREPQRTPPPPDSTWSIGAGGGAGWSSGTAGIARLVAGWERRRLAIRFGPDLWLPTRYEDGDPVPRGVSVGHALAQVRACFVPGRATWAIPLCGGARAGASFARGFGVQDARTRFSLAAATLASLGLRWRPGSESPGLGLFVQTDAAVQLTRPRFHTADRPPAYIGSSIALAVLAGAEVRFDVRRTGL